MIPWTKLATMCLVLVISLLPLASVQAADVRIGINIGASPPPVVVPLPPPVVVTTAPQLIVVPGTTVYYAPHLPHNYFYHNKRYYVFHNDGWFYASSHNGPWTFIAREHVPQPVLAVPVQYYRVPPGHTKHHGPPPWAGPGHHRKHHHKHHDKD
jgi:hypothetical protein